ERGVALESRELEIGSRVDDRVEQSRRVLLRVGEARAVQVHEARVAADVGDHEQRVDGAGSYVPDATSPGRLRQFGVPLHRNESISLPERKHFFSATGEPLLSGNHQWGGVFDGR